MSSPARRARLSFYVGATAFLVGALDPLEGSLVIFAGTVLLVASELLQVPKGRALRFWLGVAVSVSVGVAAMLALSAVGGIGGMSGRSMWWGLLILPYPIGWLLGCRRLIILGIQAWRRRYHPS